MTAITITDLSNAKLDTDHIAEVATSTGATAIDRLGNVKSTVSGAVDSLKAFNVRGAFAGSTAYAVRDVYTSAGIAYVALTDHTSTNVAADLAAGKVGVHQGVTRAEIKAEGKNLTDFFQIGNADYTIAMLAANAWPSPVFIPPGEYVVKAQIPLRNTFYGSGRGISTLTFSGIIGMPAITNFDGAFYIGLYDLTINAQSWDGVTGCTGHGIESTVPFMMDKVEVTGFKRSNLYLHHNMASSLGPYYSDIANCTFSQSGEHGVVVGDGANSLVLRNNTYRWAGCTAYKVAPTVLGVWDGLFVGSYNDGTAWPEYDPEGVHIIGGDASYNSRYGWNIAECRSSHITTDYSEGNFHVDQVALGVGVRASVINFGMGLSNSFAVTETQSTVNPNRVTLGGKYLGTGYLGADSLFENRDLTNLNNNLSQGSSYAMALTSDAAGNVIFKGVGTPQINLESISTLYGPSTVGWFSQVHTPTINSVSTLDYAAGANAAMTMTANALGYMTLSGTGFEPQILLDVITNAKSLKAVGGFGCNGKAIQVAAVSGGTLAGVIAALVANGILAS